ncbi:UNKNOWN [Stylonychia lemnae]|uniref:Uncharacterized protein n=1 Tax=Stylonychia lemnae TaxID=5949 RepID=A0A077ZYV7_STYLE|nr:UNKNOWN [Stylonychia lemnae]|eukprot:CDW75141.1 UNKNOWN [Stylonychia lemnae]
MSVTRLAIDEILKNFNEIVPLQINLMLKQTRSRFQSVKKEELSLLRKRIKQYNNSNTDSQNCQIELYSKYKQIKQRKIFDDKEQRFLDSLSEDQTIHLVSTIKLTSAEQPITTEYDDELPQIPESFYEEVENILCQVNVRLIDFPGKQLNLQQLPKLASLNNELYLKIKELDQQVDKLYAHWKQLSRKYQKVRQQSVSVEQPKVYKEDINAQLKAAKSLMDLMAL